MKLEDRINRKNMSVILISEHGYKFPISIKFIKKVKEVNFYKRNLKSRIFFKTGGCNDFQDSKEDIEKLIKIVTTPKWRLRNERLNKILNK